MAQLGEISVQLAIDTSDLKDGLKRVEKATKETSESVKKTGDQIQDSFKKATDTVDKSFVEMLSGSKKVWVQMADGSKAFIDSTGRVHNETGKLIKDTEGLGKAFKEALAGNVDSANKLKSAITGVEEKVKDTEKKVKDTEKQTDKSTKKMADGFKNIGTVLSASVTPVILGIGAAAVAIASEFDGANAKIQNSLGITAEQAGQLADSVKNVYKKGIGESQAEVTDALIKTRHNMRELADEDLEKVTKQALVLGKTFDSDVNEITRAGNNLMKAFGISSEKAFDLMASGAQNGLNFSSEMFDNLSEYSILFDDMGFSAEEYFQLLQKGTDAGVYNLDYVNDIMKEFQIRVKDGSKATSDAMDGMSEGTQKVWQQYLKGEKTVKDVHNTVIAELKGMDDQVKANEIGVGLYGVKFEDMEAEAVYALGGIDGAIGNVGGTMEDMIKVQEATFGARFQGMLRDFKSSLMPLGEILIEIGEDWIPIISESLKTASEWFKNLSEPMQRVVVVGGAVVAALGPIIVGIGFLVSAITSIGGAVLAAGGASVVLAGIAAALTGPVAVAILGVIGLALTVGSLVKHFKSASIEADIFGKEVSKGTEKAVTAYLDLEKDASTSLKTLSWGQQRVTDDMVTELVGKYNKMGDAILEEMKADHTAQLSEMEDFFKSNSSLTAEEEAKALDKMKEAQIKEQEEIKAAQTEIETILRESKANHGRITKEAADKVAEIEEGMRTKAVTVMSESELEQKAILERMKTEQGILTAERAADVISNSIASKNAIIDESTAAFLRAEENANLAYEQGAISKEQRDKIIGDAKAVKEESIAAAEETHQKVVNEAKNQAGEHARYIDEETGQIKTKWKVFKEDVVTKTKEMYTGVTGWFSDMWKSITTKATEISTSVGTKFGEIKTKITGKIEEAKTRVGELVADIKGFFTNMKLSLPKIKMPSFGIENWSINPADWIKAKPRLKVTWNKSGGFINNAGLVGMHKGVLQGAGEAGKEAIVPLEYKQGMAPFSNAVANVVADQIESLISTNNNTGVNIQIGSLVVREEADVERIAKELKRLMERQQRAGGVVNYGY